MNKVAEKLIICHGSMHQIVQYYLYFNKLSVKWVPHQLILELKERPVDVCETLLRRYETEGTEFL